MPNFVLILTDDQRADMLSPGVLAQFAQQGFKFKNAFATTPCCGPSRVSILTGQYASKHGVLTNIGTAAAFGNRASIATILRGAGYSTAYVGKWLNDYEAISPQVPPDWNQFLGFVRPNYGDQNNFDLNRNGVEEHYTGAYLTDVLCLEVLNLIQTLPEPFFIVFAPGAPHSPYVAAGRHAGIYANQTLSVSTSRFEAAMADKPQWLRDFQTAHQSNQAQLEADITIRHNIQREMLLAVDDAVAGILTGLTSRGVINNTALFYMSDNGIMEYEHWWAQKMLGYDESTRIPFLVRYSGWGGTGIEPKKLVCNIDIAPTIAAMAGTVMPNADGKDIRTIFVSPGVWRTFFKLEYWKHNLFPWANIPGYVGAREANFLYLQHEDGFEELYDLALDSAGLTNVVNEPQYLATKTRLRWEAGL